MSPSFILLTRHLGADMPARWPCGVHLARFDAAVHPSKVHALLCEAYGSGGGSVAALAEWWDGLRSDKEYDPALVFLAADPDSRIVGVAFCWTSGFVKDLAVSTAWRRKGIGSALLRHAFETFRRRGAQSVSLKVERDNPHGAERLYRSLGMVGRTAID